MELGYDWRTFQGLFYSQRRAGASGAQVGPIFTVVEGDTIVAAYADDEDFSDWIGASLREMTAQTGHREIVSMDRAKVDEWNARALELPTYYEQLEFLREKASGKGRAPAPGHFLLEGILGWWSRVLPSSYGIFVRVEGRPRGDFLLIVRRGMFSAFEQPDLTSMIPDRRKEAPAVVRFLAERYLVPVQGIFVSPEDWDRWSQSENPWREVAQALRSNRAKLAPFRWSLATLIGARAFLGI